MAFFFFISEELSFGTSVPLWSYAVACAWCMPLPTSGTEKTRKGKESSP